MGDLVGHLMGSEQKIMGRLNWPLSGRDDGRAGSARATRGPSGPLRRAVGPKHGAPRGNGRTACKAWIQAKLPPPLARITILSLHPHGAHLFSRTHRETDLPQNK